MNQGMKSQQFQYPNYTPGEFEQFRNAMQLDGFTITQNTIDTVTGHIGSLTYITGAYNRNQQLLTVTVKTSPWQSLQDSELKNNINRIVARSTEDTGVKTNPQAVKTPPVQTVNPLGTNKNIVQPATPLKTATPTQTPAPAQTPKPAEPTKEKEEPAKVATPAAPASTPSKS